MKKLLSFWALLLLTVVAASAQKRFAVYAVGFYNQENLFDTIHDEGKNDYEFLPNGSYHWDGLRFSHKLRNMSKVLSEMGTDVLPNVGCAMIGLSEVENSRVLDALIAQEPLQKRGYKYVHVEGPDRRGVDCAMLYNPKLFTVRNVKLVPYVPVLPKDSAYKTRGFLTVSGTLAGEHVAVVVCHWPSRFATSFYREQAGKQVRAVKDSLLRADPQVKVLVMGDMNDDPIDKSMQEALGAKGDINAVRADEMYNPWYNILVKQKTGTLEYQGAWNLFDQIVMTPNMIVRNKQDDGTLKFWKPQIFSRPYLFQTEGKYKGYPKRTTAGGVWMDGYSDHLPVVVYLKKEVK